MKPKVYETFAQQKIDQRIGFAAFPIVNIVVGLVVWLLSGWVDSITIEPAVRHPNLRLAIALLPWVANGLLLLVVWVIRLKLGSFDDLG